MYFKKFVLYLYVLVAQVEYDDNGTQKRVNIANEAQMKGWNRADVSVPWESKPVNAFLLWLRDVRREKKTSVVFKTTGMWTIPITVLVSLLFICVL